MAEVLKLIALLGLQEGEHLVDAARGARVFAAAVAASISCVLDRIVELAALACEKATLVDAVCQLGNQVDF